MSGESSQENYSFLLNNRSDFSLINILGSAPQSGDKQAQLDLGIRFEEGKGVPQDKRQAIKLYRQAAMDSIGTQWIYMPSPGNGAPGRVVPFETGQRQAGLDEARSRLKERMEDHNGN